MPADPGKRLQQHRLCPLSTMLLLMMMPLLLLAFGPRQASGQLQLQFQQQQQQQQQHGHQTILLSSRNFKIPDSERHAHQQQLRWRRQTRPIKSRAPKHGSATLGSKATSHDDSSSAAGVSASSSPPKGHGRRRVRIARSSCPDIETHQVTTEDGYVLGLHRLANGSADAPVVFVQHGLLESSLDWLVAGEDRSLPCVLASHGYDVWLGNARGNTHSRKHKTLATSEAQFWDFSWHELGSYDLPAALDYVSRLRGGAELFYVGHSMGATSFAVMASSRPEATARVKAAVLLAPATYVGHMRAPVRLLAPFWSRLQRLSNSVGMYELMPRGPFFDAFAKHVCGSFMLRNVLCSNSLFVLAGFNPEQLDHSLLQKIWSHFPAGTSMKLFVHWLQQIAGKDFREFDYGWEVNRRLYNSSQPRLYDIERLQVPTAVFWSANDLLVGEKDVLRFYEQLPNKLGVHKVNDTHFNHFDFLWGADAPELVYAPMIDIMADFGNQIGKN